METSAGKVPVWSRTTVEVRARKYHKGGIYFNANINKTIIDSTVPAGVQAGEWGRPWELLGPG
jgi:hypothetical protein